MRAPCEYDNAAHGVDGETAPAEGETDVRYLCKRCINADNDYTCQPCRIDEDEAADAETADEDDDDDDDEDVEDEN